MAEPFIYIVNLQFSTGIFPDALKKAVITPLHKKGCRESVENYRPLALLSVFSKIIEKAFLNKLIHFLEKFSLLKDCQHGFRKGRSTTTAMLNFMNYLSHSLENRKSTIGVFYDFTKAFDMIPHKILLTKLSQYGITGIANLWIKSYLSDRKQVTKLKDLNGITYHSDEVITNIGVPQGL